MNCPEIPDSSITSNLSSIYDVRIVDYIEGRRYVCMMNERDYTYGVYVPSVQVESERCYCRISNE